MKLLSSFLIVLTLFLQDSYLEIGDMAPDIALNTPEGKEIKLSSLKGKVVLVDFWASWCKPCRKENPMLVKMYDKYKGEAFDNGNGFEIYSVSLDKKEEAWKKAIAADSLIWQSHVSDLGGWHNAAARDYRISAIPKSYLLDGEGKIIAVNPRGSKLEKELKKIKKSDSWFSGWF